MNTYELAAAALIAQSGCTIRRYRRSNSGCADLTSVEWEIEVPPPVGPISFGIFAHEVGHQLRHRNVSGQRWMQEVEAEEFALECFDAFELKGKARYEQHAANHLAYTFWKAIRRGRPDMADRIRERAPEWWERTQLRLAAWAVVGEGVSQ